MLRLVVFPFLVLVGSFLKAAVRPDAIAVFHGRPDAIVLVEPTWQELKERLPNFEQSLEFRKFLYRELKIEKGMDYTSYVVGFCTFMLGVTSVFLSISPYVYRMHTRNICYADYALAAFSLLMLGVQGLHFSKLKKTIQSWNENASAHTPVTLPRVGCCFAASSAARMALAGGVLAAAIFPSIALFMTNMFDNMRRP